MLFQVALIDHDGVVVHTGASDASTAEEAIESERRFAQLPYCRAEAYDYYEMDAEPVLSKPCFADFGTFRTVV